MTNRLLEIGASPNTAIANPGDVLRDENLEYFAIDAKDVSTIVTWSKLSAVDAEAWPHERHKKACVGTMDKLPFRSGLFGQVIMKNLVGEYSLNLQRDKGIHSPGMMSRQTYADTMQGFRDVLRVLQPGGRLIISRKIHRQIACSSLPT